MSGRFDTADPAATEQALYDIGIERERQVAKWGPRHHPDGTNGRYAILRDQARAYCDQQAKLGPGTDSWLNILREEFYEAAAEEDQAALRKELIQAAAVAVAWIEDIDSRG